MRVLLIEDDAEVARLIVQGFGEHDIRVDHEAEFRPALFRALEGEFTVVVLDLMLPGGDGLELCARLRGEGVRTPILMLTARSALDDRVAGFESGADDYLAKPFAFRELLARVRALARRSAGMLDPHFELADLSLNLRTREVRRGGEEIRLTTKEWQLLEYLVRHAGSVVDRPAIAAYVWDENHDPFTNVLEVLMRRLRRKIDDGREPKLIHTVRGSGYRLGL